jgi:poly [ADP-ribose] polymerase 2/3/4
MNREKFLSERENVRKKVTLLNDVLSKLGLRIAEFDRLGKYSRAEKLEARFSDYISELEHLQTRYMELSRFIGDAGDDETFRQLCGMSNDSFGGVDDEHEHDRDNFFQNHAFILAEFNDDWQRREFVKTTIEKHGGRVDYLCGDQSDWLVISRKEWLAQREKNGKLYAQATGSGVSVVTPAFVVACASLKRAVAERAFQLMRGTNSVARTRQEKLERMLKAKTKASAEGDAFASIRQQPPAPADERRQFNLDAMSAVPLSLSTLPCGDDYEVASYVLMVDGSRFCCIEVHVATVWVEEERDTMAADADAALEYRTGVLSADLVAAIDRYSKVMVEQRHYRVYEQRGTVAGGGDDVHECRHARSALLAQQCVDALHERRLAEGYRRVDVLTRRVGSSVAQRQSSLMRIESGDQSALDSRTRRLVKSIFDAALTRVGSAIIGPSGGAVARITTRGTLETPMGTVGIDALASARVALLRLAAALRSADVSAAERAAAEFYKLVPHRVVEPLRSVDNVRDKLELCQLLADLLGSGETMSGAACRAPLVDLQYASLRCSLRPRALPRTLCEELARCKVQAISAFAVHRSAEARLFRRGLSNQRTMFHGTSDANVVGLLSRGPLVPNAASVGDGGLTRRDAGMLGAGIYFASSASVAAKYSGRYLLVCTVALGHVRRYSAHQTQLTAPPPGYTSVQGVAGGDSQFEDDEYAIFDARQQRIDYVLEIDSSSSLPGVASSSSSSSKKKKKKAECCAAMSVDNGNDVARPAAACPAPSGGSRGACGLIAVGGGASIPLTKVAVRGRLVDVVGECTVLQHYRNASSSPIEAKYVFPLDEFSAVCAFEAFIDGRHIVGVVKEKEQAHKEYREAVARGDGAYLLDVDEEKPDVFTVSVGNLPGGAEVLIKITYVTELSVSDGGRALDFLLPSTVAPRFAARALGTQTQSTTATAECDDAARPLSIELSLSMPSNIVRLGSPSHAVRFKRSATTATVQLVDAELGGADFVLRIGVAAPHEPRMWVEVDEHNHMAAMLAFCPQFDSAGDDGDNELLLLLDCSGSMRDGAALDDMKRAARAVIERVGARVRLNVVAFGSTSESLLVGASRAAGSVRAQALGFVDSLRANRGGTDLCQALRSRYLVGTAATNVLVVSDALASQYELAIELAALGAASRTGRTFVLGVGKQCDRHLATALARAGGGSVEVLAPRKNPWRRVARICDNVTQPSLADISVEWDSDRGTVVQAPNELISLFSGQRRIVYGMIEGGGYCTKATLHARINGRPISSCVSTSDMGFAHGRTVHTLAARARVRDYDEGLYSRDPLEHRLLKSSKKSEIVELGVRFSLATKFTSFIAIEKRDEESMQALAAEQRAKQQRAPTLDELVACESVDELDYRQWTATLPASDLGLAFFSLGGGDDKPVLGVSKLGLFAADAYTLERRGDAVPFGSVASSWHLDRATGALHLPARGAGTSAPLFEGIVQRDQIELLADALSSLIAASAPKSRRRRRRKEKRDGVKKGSRRREVESSDDDERGESNVANRPVALGRLGIPTAGNANKESVERNTMKKKKKQKRKKMKGKRTKMMPMSEHKYDDDDDEEKEIAVEEEEEVVVEEEEEVCAVKDEKKKKPKRMPAAPRRRQSLETGCDGVPRMVAGFFAKVVPKPAPKPALSSGKLAAVADQPQAMAKGDVADQYELLNVVGRGAAGKVARARDKSTGQKVNLLFGSTIVHVARDSWQSSSSSSRSSSFSSLDSGPEDGGEEDDVGFDLFGGDDNDECYNSLEDLSCDVNGRGPSGRGGGGAASRGVGAALSSHATFDSMFTSEAVASSSSDGEFCEQSADFSGFTYATKEAELEPEVTSLRSRAHRSFAVMNERPIERLQTQVVPAECNVVGGVAALKAAVAPAQRRQQSRTRTKQTARRSTGGRAPPAKTLLALCALPLHAAELFERARVSSLDVDAAMRAADSAIADGIDFAGPYGAIRLAPSDLATLNDMERTAVCAAMRAASPNAAKPGASLLTVASLCADEFRRPSMSLGQLQLEDGAFNMSAALLGALGLEWHAVSSEIRALNSDADPSSLLWRIFATALAIASATDSRVLERATEWLERAEAEHRCRCIGSHSWLPIAFNFINHQQI